MATTTWTGDSTSNNLWSNDDNWDNDAPDSTVDAIIPDCTSLDVPLLEATAECNSLTMVAGADINGNGNNLEIHGEADGTGVTQAGYCIWVRGKFTNSLDVEIFASSSTNCSVTPSDSSMIRDLKVNKSDVLFYTIDALSLSRNLNINQGTFNTQNNNLTVPNLVTVNGTFTGTTDGTLTFGSLKGTGTFHAPTSTVEIDDRDESTGKALDIDGLTIATNDLNVNITSDKNQDLDIGDDKIHDLTINSVTNTRINYFTSNGSIDGDLTITSGILNTFNRTLEVDGACSIAADGKLEANVNGNVAVTLGSLTIASGGIYNATSATTTLTSKTSSGNYSLDNQGTFTNNSGTIKVTGDGGHIREQGTGDINNLIVELGGSSETHKLSDSTTVGGTLTIVEGDFQPNGRNLTVTGDVSIESGGTITGSSGAMSFGSLTIASGGTYLATSGTTTCKGDVNVASGGTFTHNDGTFLWENTTGGSITGFGAGAPAFYNLEISSSTTNDIFPEWDFTVRNVFDTNGQQIWIHPSSRDVTITMGFSDATAVSTGATTGGLKTGGWIESTLKAYQNHLNDIKLYGASQIYPAQLSDAWLTFSHTGQADCTWYLKNFNIVSGFNTTHTAKTGSNAIVILDGDCEFAAVTVTTGDTFNVNGQRAEFSGTFTATGTITGTGYWYFTGSGTLAIGGGASWTHDATAIVQQGTSTNTISLRDSNAVGTVFYNQPSVQMNTTSHRMGRQHIVGAGTWGFTSTATGTTTDLTVATAGTLLETDASTISIAGDFTMSGGLIGKSAVLFDGTDDVGSAPSASASTTNPTDNLFVEAWWKSTNTTPETTSVIGKEDSYLLYINASGYLQGYAYASSSDISISGGWVGSIFDEKWHHIAMGYSQAGGLKIWLDGRLVGHNTTDAGTLDQNANGLRIMRYGSNYGQGTVAMGRIWTGAVPTDAQLRSNMFKGEGDSPAYTSGVIQSAWYFDEGTGTTVEDVGVGTDADLTLEGSPAWADMGTFTPGDSTLKFNKAGTQYLRYKTPGGTAYAAGVHIVNGSTTILEDVDGNQHPLYISGSLTVSGTFDNTSQEYCRFGNNFVTNGSSFDVDNGTITGISSFVNDASSALPLTAGTYPAWDVYYGPLSLSADVTLNSGIRLFGQGSGDPELRLNGYTATVKEYVSLRTDAVLNIGSGTLHYDHAAGSGITTTGYTGQTLQAGPGATIKGHSSTSKTVFESKPNFTVVGTVENLNVTTEELNVTGKVINCTGDIHQWHNTIDSAQQLDRDTADDRDINLGRDLDKNTELVG